MNVSQYTVNERLASDAIASITLFSSVEERIVAAGERISGRSENPEDVDERNTFAYVDFTCELDSNGKVCILQCTSGATAIDVPEMIGGHPVTAIGDHAFCTCYSLENIGLPGGIEAIGRYAFMNTALTEFVAPPSLRFIGENAFYRCVRLERVSLNEGLAAIGRNAFRESALSALRIPASVEYVGQDAFKSTGIAFAGPKRTLTINPGNDNLLLDEGVLYGQSDEGTMLVQALDDAMTSFLGRMRFDAVAGKAFANMSKLEYASLPEGVVSVGDKAFAGCTSLKRVDLPDSLRVLGNRVFQDTALSELCIPVGLAEAGTAAFYTGGSIARKHKPTIAHIEVDPRNTRFFMKDGILCHRNEKGGVTALLYAGEARHLIIPREITEIGAYAFLNCESVCSIDIHDAVGAIDVGGLDTGYSITSVIFSVYAGHDHVQEQYVVSFPPGYAGRQAAKITFARGEFDLTYAFAAADDAIFATQDTFIRAKAILERLNNPVMLDDSTRAALERRIRKAVPATVVSMGKNGFLQGIDLLFEVGAITQDNIDATIEAANEAGELAVLSRLIELKRTAFHARMFDFDL